MAVRNYTKSELVAMTVANAQRYGIDPVTAVAQIQQESGFKANATGPNTKYGTAKGIAQFIDATAQAYGVRNPYDPADALPGWGRYMRDLQAQFGRIDYALAAYNAGPGNVKKYGGIPPFSQTQNYVKTILSRSAQDKARAMIAESGGPVVGDGITLGAMLGLFGVGAIIYTMVK